MHSRDQALLNAVGRVLAEEIDSACKPLRERIETLQTRVAETESALREVGWKGVWQPDVTYRAGNFVSLGGSTWVCVAEQTLARPVTGGADWGLMVKRGRDGKDGHVVAEPHKPRQPTLGRSYGS